MNVFHVLIWGVKTIKSYGAFRPLNCVSVSNTKVMTSFYLGMCVCVFFALCHINDILIDPCGTSLFPWQQEGHIQGPDEHFNVILIPLSILLFDS